MKFTFSVLLILFSVLISSIHAQNDLPVLPDRVNNPEDFVPANWRIAKKLVGDLNADGSLETVLVLQGANQALIKEASFMDYNVSVKDEKTGNLKWLADNNPVILAVLSQEKDGYKLNVQNNRLIPLFEDNWYRWNHSFSLENNTLKVELSGRISSGISDNFGETKRIFRFQMQNSKLILIEAEETFWFQAMLARTGRKDRYEIRFTANKGFMVSTVSLDKQPAKSKSCKIGT